MEVFQRFYYFVQDRVGSVMDTVVAPGASFTMSVSVGGTANVYQWEKYDNPISGAENDTLVLDSMSIGDVGRYTCRITNTIATGLTLYSQPVNLSVSNSPPETFTLLSPVNDSTIVIDEFNLWNNLYFNWEWTTDVDGDPVRYGFKLTDGLDGLLIFDDTATTQIWLPFEDLVTFMESRGQLVITGTWDIFATDGESATWSNNGPFTLTIDASTLDILRQAFLPQEYALHQNYPNPFNPSTTLRFDLPEAADIHIVVYDLLGKEVARLVEQRLEAGYHHLVWNGRNRNGREVPTGMYIVLMATPEYRKSVKLLLLK